MAIKASFQIVNVHTERRMMRFPPEENNLSRRRISSWPPQRPAGHSKRLKRNSAVDSFRRLPDHVLHHNLSFLDTKLMVQTSLLSRRWRFAWREVTSLIFNESCFSDMPIFAEHVGKLLSLRSSSAAISCVTLDCWGRFTGRWLEALHWDLFNRIMEHAAASRDSRRLHHLSLSLEDHSCFADLYASIWANRHHGNLGTLKLDGVNLEFGGGRTVLDLGLKALTKLELRGCNLFPASVSSEMMKSSFDPFANLPCLKYLKLLNCDSLPSCLLRVSGFELLELEIEYPIESSRSQKIEVFAPKLKSFRFSGGTEQLVGLILPSDVCTKIHAKQRQRAECDFEEYYDEAFMSEIMKWRSQRPRRH